MFLKFVSTEQFEMARNVSADEIFVFLRQIADSKQVQHPTLLNYTVKCLLGRGTTSDVYCALENNTENNLVLKIPHESYVSSVAAEARIMKRMAEDHDVLHCPNLCKFLDRVTVQVGQREAQAILLSYPATTASIRLSPGDVVELAGALKVLHRAGFLHRDVSPGNIGHYGPIKKNEREGIYVPFLRDFGFALQLQEPFGEVRVPFAGTLSTASQRILKELEAGNTSPLIGPQDDVESLCKSVLLLASHSFPLFSNAKEKNLVEKAKCMREFWESRKFPLEVVSTIVESQNYEAIKVFAACLPIREPLLI